MSQQAHIYRWDRHGRKGQLCIVVARGTMNGCLVKFEDGYTMVTSPMRSGSPTAIFLIRTKSTVCRRRLGGDPGGRRPIAAVRRRIVHG